MMAVEAPKTYTVSCLILGLHVRFTCTDPLLHDVLIAAFGAMVSRAPEAAVDLEYSVHGSGLDAPFSIVRRGCAAMEGCGPSDFLYLLEKDLTIELQKRRAGLFFLHAAALDWQGEVCLLAGDSGRGKSTTTWGLLHRGFAYLSDELSPIDLDSLEVSTYPHALCLKQPPPAYPLPPEALHLGRTIHVPAWALPAETVTGSRPLGAVFVLEYRRELAEPRLFPLTPAEASARLYATALNALSHANHGLEAVVKIAEAVPCFAVWTADLPATCALIRDAAERATS